MLKLINEVDNLANEYAKGNEDGNQLQRLAKILEPVSEYVDTHDDDRVAREFYRCGDAIDFVDLRLSWEWSPEQINGVSHRIGMPVSHEWIYRYVAADKKALGGKLYQRFRQGRKRDRNGSEQQALGDSESALYRGSARRGGRDPRAVRGLGALCEQSAMSLYPGQKGS